MHMKTKVLSGLCCLALGTMLLALSGCGGGSSSNSSSGTFTLAVSTGSVSMLNGGTATGTATVTADSSFSGTVTLSATGLPSGMSVSFSPASLNGSGTSTFTFSALSVASGTYTVTVKAVSGSTSMTTGIDVTVNSAPSTSGEIAALDIGGNPYGFIPTPAGVSFVKLAGSGSSPVDVPNAASAPVALDFTPNSCAGDQVQLKVVCVGYDSSKVGVLDVSPIADGNPPTVTEFDLHNTVYSSFSGGGCLDCGVLTDSANDRFVLSSGDGYRVVGYDGTVQAEYLDDPTSANPDQFTTENFAFDAAHQMIISPEYETSTQNLWLIDVAADKVYKWDKTLTDANVSIADAAAVDPSTNTVWIDNEFEDRLLGINLNAGTFSGNTFSGPWKTTDLVNVDSDGDFTTGMAIDPSSHTMLLEDEFTSNFGAVQLPASAGTSAPAFSSYTSAVMPDSTACGAWYNPGDPHGLAVLPVGFIGSDAYGMLVNDSATCVALVDVTKLLAAPKASGMNAVDPSYDLVANGVVQFIAL